MRRWLVWALLGALTAAVSAPAAVGAEPWRVTVAARAGFDGRGKADHWVPLVVEVENQGGQVQGDLLVRQTRGAAQPSTLYAVPVVLAQGAKKKYTFSVPVDPTARTVEVSLESAGQEAARTYGTISAVVSADDMLVGVLSKDPLALDLLGQIKLTGKAGSVRVSHLTPETLPANITLLSNFDLIAINRFDSTQLSSEQLRTLESWVRRGGMLVLGGGPEWKNTVQNLPDVLVPVVLDGTRSVQDLPILASLGGQKLPEGQPFVISTGVLRQGYALAQHGADPVLAVSRVGQGTVLFFALDLALEPMTNWQGAPEMWEKLLLQYRGGGLWSARSTTSGRNSALLVRALETVPSLEMPSTRTLANLLAIYLLVVGPLNYGVLALLRKKHLMWVTVPLLSLAALAGGYYHAFHVQGREALTHSITVTEIVEGETMASSRSYIGFFAPSRTRLRVPLSEGALAAALPFSEALSPGSSASGRSGEVTRVTLDRVPSVDFLGLNMWSMRGLLVDREVPVPQGGVEFDLNLRGSQLVGRVTNNTGQTLVDPVILTAGMYQLLPTLPPGGFATVQLTLQQPRFFRPVFQNIYPSPQGSTAPQHRLNSYRRQIAEGTFGPSHETIPGPVLFYGWVDEGPGLTVGGRAVQGTHLRYTVVEPKLDPRRFDIPPGLITGRIVGAQGQTWNRSPGGYTLMSSTLTFALQVPDIDRSVLQDVILRVDASNPQAAWKLRALDWQKGEWEELQTVVEQPLGGWERYLAPDGTLLVQVQVESENKEIRLPTIGLRGGV